MDHRKGTLKQPRAAAAFTLIELMLVMVVMALLLGVSSDFFGDSMRSQRLTAASLLLAGDLNHAVLLAQKENRPIEIRFLRFEPADSLDGGGEETSQGQFYAYQFAILTGFDAGNQPTYRILSEVKHFPNGVALMPEEEFTSILSLPERSPGPNDPKIGPDYTMVSFQFRPDGTTSLPPASKPVLTLVELQNLSSTLPPNYRSITIDPGNGQTRVY